MHGLPLLHDGLSLRHSALRLGGHGARTSASATCATSGWSRADSPACVEACPEKATIFGTREELLAEAHRRIEQNPGRYSDKVYGETEVGGTSVIYISDIPLDFLGFKPNLGDKPLPELTWAALSKVPPLIVGMGGLMAGVWWIVGRRMKLAEEEQHVDAPESGETAEPAPEEKETEA